ncbi:MAG TPA: DUF86 domain-containing protein [Dehalococcoidia bacterium]|nr:DUF86 domain-containing protein [Dehalococcoidia bacterium]
MRDDQKDNRVYFWHIRDAINRIEQFTQGGREQFFRSEMVQGAVVWNLGIIGEAVRQVTASLKASHPGVPWQQVISMRNRLVHEYFNVDLELVWNVVAIELPHLKAQVEVILEELEGQPDVEP